jgi:hypothetical protein
MTLRNRDFGGGTFHEGFVDFSRLKVDINIHRA